MEVLVGITCRNVEYTIGPVLKSILRLDYPKSKIRVLIVDSESTDHTVPIAKSILEKSNVRYELIVRRCSIPQGRNIILDYLCRENLDVVLFVDADVLINDTDLLSKLEHILSTYGKSVVSFRVESLQFNSKSELEEFANRVLISGRKVHISEIKCLYWCVMGLTAVPLEIARNVRFNEKLTFAEDRRFGYDVWRCGGKVLGVIGSEPFGFDLNVKRKTSLYSKMSIRDYLRGVRDKAHALAYTHFKIGFRWIYKNREGRKVLFHATTAIALVTSVPLLMLDITKAGLALLAWYTASSLSYIAKQLREQETLGRAIKNLIKQQMYCPLMFFLVPFYMIKYKNIFSRIESEVEKCNRDVCKITRTCT